MTRPAGDDARRAFEGWLCGDCDEFPEPTCGDCGAECLGFDADENWGGLCPHCEADNEEAAIEAERHAAEAVAAWFAAEAEAHQIERELRCERAMWAAHDAVRLRSE